MGKTAALCRGYHPWEPRSGVTDVLVMHGHDVPLVGIYEINDRYQTLFVCLEGHVDDIKVWAYVPLSLDEASEIRSRNFDDVDHLMTEVLSLVAEKAGTVALSIDDRIVVSADVVEGSSISAALAMMTDTVSRTAESAREHIGSAQEAVLI